MATALRYAARSDVGLLRDGNEDSGYAGPRLLVVADGMGGHVAGEVASSLAVATLAALDEDAPGPDLLGSLRTAVEQANSQIAAMTLGDPALEGMGTTLTALLRTGSRFGVVHVGDSRAYLLRDGQLEQITHDHTFVQSLVDEGRITREEADSHPQRSLITRALTGHEEVDPDLSVREARAGDRYLICSDGLSSVVSFDSLHDVLASVPDPDEACRALVQYALRGGGPDNVTVIVADVVDAGDGPSQVPQVVGAVAEDRVQRRGSGGGTSSAGRAAALRLQPELVEEPVGPVQRTRRWPLLVLLLIVLAGLLGGGYAAWAWSQRQYYVGASDGHVAIYRGIPQSLAGLSLSSVVQQEDTPLAALPVYSQQQLQDGITVDNLQEAQNRVHILSEQAAACQRVNPPLFCREAASSSASGAASAGSTSSSSGGAGSGGATSASPKASGSRSSGTTATRGRSAPRATSIPRAASTAQARNPARAASTARAAVTARATTGARR